VVGGLIPVESVLSKACTIKIQNFEGPFDLLFHLIEQNKINIYDIPINVITDQYMEYLFEMQELDMEIASEFLIMASTLLHIKSRLLLPREKKLQKEDEAPDPRVELVTRLLEYKKYKDFSIVLKEREDEWSKVFYKLPESIQFARSDETIELSPEKMKSVYAALIEKYCNREKQDTAGISRIVQTEKVSLRSKMKEITFVLLNRASIKFSEIFNIRKRSKAEVITGFMAVLELARLKKVIIEQKKLFGEITIYKKM